MCQVKEEEAKEEEEEEEEKVAVTEINSEVRKTW